MMGRVSLCLGYGLYLSTSATGVVGLAHIVALAGDVAMLLVAQLAYVLATTISCFALSRMDGLGTLGEHDVLRRAAFVVGLAALTLCHIPGAGHVPLIVGMFVYGGVMAVPKICWYEEFLEVNRASGRAASVDTIGCCFVVALIPALLAGFVSNGGVASLAVTACLVVLAWVSQEISLGIYRAPAIRGASFEKAPVRYRVTRYGGALLTCFGVTWGLACCVLARPEISVLFIDLPGVLLAVVAFVAALAVLAIRFGKTRIHSVHYSYIVRCSIALVGCSWAVIPLLADYSASAVGVVCMLDFLLQGIVMILFSVDTCVELDIPLRPVATACYFVFGAAAVVGMLVCLLCLLCLERHTFYSAVACAAVLVSLAIVPLLPSRNSQASVFALDDLPEDESYRGRVQSKRTSLIDMYGLSQREWEVVELLLDGKTRAQIAEELSISPWTVKTHTSSAYEKMNVHSVKELILIVTDDKPR